MQPKPKKIELNPEVAKQICWGRPDSPRRPFCALCHGYLDDDDVPVMIWKPDGSGAAFCDPCVERLFRMG